MSVSQQTPAISGFKVKGGGLDLSFRLTDDNQIEVQNNAKGDSSVTIAIIFQFDAGIGFLSRPQGSHNLTLKPREKVLLPLGEITTGYRILKVDDGEVMRWPIQAA